MIRICTSVLLIYFAVNIPVFASDFESRLDEDGRFLNRLRLETGGRTLGLISSVSDGNLEFLEPVYRSAGLEAGRLVLKGILREHYNPSGGTADASVYTECGTAAATASFSRSPRVGAVFFPYGAEKSAFWLFRANSGVLSFGAAAINRHIFSTGGRPAAAADCDLLLTACTAEAEEPESAFSDRPVVPAQAVAHPSAELRINAGAGVSEAAGRKHLRTDADGAGASLSAAAILSLPQYTRPGAQLRLYGSAGSSLCSLNGIVRLTAEGFITPSGDESDEILSAGVSGKAAFGPLNIDAGYNYILGRPEVRPSRYYPAAEKAGAGMVFAIGLLEADLQISGRRSIDIRGRENIDLCAAAGAKASIGNVSLTADCRLDVDDMTGDDYNRSFRTGLGAVYSSSEIKIGLSAVIGEERSCRADFDADAGEADICFGAEVSDSEGFRFSVGIKSDWRSEQ